MNYDKAQKLEMLIRNLVEDETGKAQPRFSTYKGVTMDAASFNNDAKAIEGLWLAIELLQKKQHGVA
jgi:hypothetical protein